MVEGELKTVGVQNPEDSADWEGKEVAMDTMASPADENEAADKMEEYGANRAINDTLEIRFNNIRRALEKMDDGTFGTCEICHKEIEEERLDANPAARTCEAHLSQDSTLLA